MQSNIKEAIEKCAHKSNAGLMTFPKDSFSKFKD